MFNCLLLFLEVSCPDARWTRELSRLLNLLLHQLVTLSEHCLFQFDSDDLTELLGVETDVMVLTVVNLGIVADEVDVAQ